MRTDTWGTENLLTMGNPPIHKASPRGIPHVCSQLLQGHSSSSSLAGHTTKDHCSTATSGTAEHSSSYRSGCPYGLL